MYRLTFQDLSDQEAAKVRQEEQLRQRSLDRMQAERAVANARRKAELDELIAYEARLRKQYDEETSRQIERGIQERARGGPEALKRSIVVPGWGQYYHGHPGVGGLILAAFVGAASYSVSSYQRYVAAREAYAAHPGNIYLLASLPSSNGAVTYAGYLAEDAAWQKADRLAGEARLGGAVTLAIYAFNLFQAYFFNSRAEALDPVAPSAGFRIDHIEAGRVTYAKVDNVTFISYVFSLRGAE